MTIANGWTLIALPRPWYFQTMDWDIAVPTTANTSPFTGEVAQVVTWPGADNWKVTVTIPPLDDDEARAWTSFLWNCAGGSTAFLLGNPLRRRPKGDPKAAGGAGIVVNGANAAMAGTLNLRGFLPNAARVLLSGDLISVNFRLYQVRDTFVSADANGDATVTIGPTIREALTDGVPVATHDATGLFRLSKSVSPFSIDANRQTSMSLQCVEAR
jgi:hypothetical protein